MKVVILGAGIVGFQIAKQLIDENKNVVIIKMDLLREDLEGVCDMVMERARKSSGFYVSIDIDSVDPSFAPGTGYIEAGGISSGDLLYF